MGFRGELKSKRLEARKSSRATAKMSSCRIDTTCSCGTIRSSRHSHSRSALASTLSRTRYDGAEPSIVRLRAVKAEPLPSPPPPPPLLFHSRTHTSHLYCLRKCPIHLYFNSTLTHSTIAEEMSYIGLKRVQGWHTKAGDELGFQTLRDGASVPRQGPVWLLPPSRGNPAPRPLVVRAGCGRPSRALS